MLYKVTNNGEARTVDFLGVFAEGEARDFTQAELENYMHMNGVPVVSGLPEDFDIEYVGEPENGGK